MKFFRVELTSHKDPKFAFLAEPPDRDDQVFPALRRGNSVADAETDDFALRMDDRNPGMQLPTLVGNKLFLFVVHRDVADVLRREVATPVEYVPLEIYDHKGGLASADHVVVNPIGTFDAVDPERCEVVRPGTKNAKLWGLPVLDGAKLERAPDLFRLPEDPYTIVISERLVDALRPVKPTNFLLTPLEITEPAP